MKSILAIFAALLLAPLAAFHAADRPVKRPVPAQPLVRTLNGSQAALDKKPQRGVVAVSLAGLVRREGFSKSADSGGLLGVSCVADVQKREMMLAPA